MRRPLIAGNWKMNRTHREAVPIVEKLKQLLGGEKDVDIVVCPPFVALRDVYEVIRATDIKLGGQDLHWEREGPYTGEVSAAMLKEAGCSFVIVGHSERRTYFGETNETVARKVKAALQAGLVPIVCVGERLEDRDAGRAESVVEDHVRGALDGLAAGDVEGIVIAYEPVWAIGTGRTATPQQAGEIHSFIRAVVAGRYGSEPSGGLRVLYGGSVNAGNIASLMKEPDIDGALVGGASLSADSFADIVRRGRKPVEVGSGR